MKKVIYADSSQIVGEEVAAVMLEFAAALASHQASEPLTFRAVGPDGGEVDASFLLGPASQIAVEEADGDQEPDNTAAIAVMRKRIAQLSAGAHIPQAGKPQESVLDGYEF